MPAPFEFFSPQRIVFGWGRRAEIGEAAKSLGRRAWFVVGSRTLQRSGVVDALHKSLAAAGVDSSPLAWIDHEPLTTDVDEAVVAITSAGVRGGDFLLAVGGGSAIDLAKAVAALARQADAAGVRDYLEGVGRGLKLAAEPLPILAMPTTGGTECDGTLEHLGMEPKESRVAPASFIDRKPSVYSHGPDAGTFHYWHPGL